MEKTTRTEGSCVEDELGFGLVMTPGQTPQEHASNVGEETRTFVHKVLLPGRTGLLPSLLQTAESVCQKHSCPLQEEN